MTMDEALEINDRLVGAYLHRNSITEGEIPSLADVTLNQAIQASEMVADHRGTKNPDGTTTLSLHIEPTRVHATLAYAIFYDKAGTAK